MVENLRDYSVFPLDCSGRVAGWNAGAERMLGYSSGEILKRTAAVFYTPEERRASRLKAELRAACEEGRCESEGWRVRKDRSLFWAQEVIVPLRDKSGVVAGFAKISRDLTERREAEDALRMMNESLERRVRERTGALESYQRELKSLAIQLSRAEVQERHRLGTLFMPQPKPSRITRYPSINSEPGWEAQLSQSIIAQS